MGLSAGPDFLEHVDAYETNMVEFCPQAFDVLDKKKDGHILLCSGFWIDLH